MLCPKCKVEMRAKASYHIEGKKLFLWQQFFCRNRQCENYGQHDGESAEIFWQHQKAYRENGRRPSRIEVKK